MVDSRVFCVSLFVSRFVDALAELSIAPGDESGVEEADVLEDLSFDQEGAGRCVVLLFEVLFYREARASVVSADEGVMRDVEFDVAAQVVDVLGVHRFEGGL